MSQDEVQSSGTGKRALAGADGVLEATVSCVTGQATVKSNPTLAGATGVAHGVDATVEAGQKRAGEGGNKMKKLAEAYGYEGKDPVVVAVMMFADPKKYVLPRPGGVAMFDVLNTTLTVRMVFISRRARP